MATDHNIRQLIINKMTDAQYEQAVKSADELYLTPDTGGGTVTSVRVQATSPVVSSQSTAQTTTLNTTISLANNYGDTKNPYASKTKNYVLAAPVSANGTPSFRALDKADIPLASETAASGGTTTSLVTTGEKYTWNNKQDALPSQSGQSGKFLTTDGSSMSWADASVEIDNSTITKNTNNEVQTVGVKDVRTGNAIKTWTGTKAQYDTFASPAWSTLAPALYERGGWGALAYGNGIFVSIGTYGYVSTSYDGTTWSDTEDSNLASQSYWYALTYDGSNFIALTSDGYISTSSDGTSWSAPTQVSNLGNNIWYNIVYDGSKLLALGYNGHISTSTDGGTTWTAATQSSTLNGKHWRGIVYTGTKFVSLSYEGYVSTSINGTTWTTPVSATSALGSNNSWFNLAYNGSKFVAIGMFGYVSESIDGINWETATRPSSFSSNAFYALAYGNSLFVTISSNNGYVSTRLDGANSDTLYNIKDYGLYLGSTEVANVSSGDSLPDQTGNSGKFLTTDGSAASWANVPAGTVTSVRVQAGTGLASSQSTAQSSTLNTTISVASGYKLPTTTEWGNKQDKLTTQTAYTSKGSATKVPQITTNTLGQVTTITEVDITHQSIKSIKSDNTTAQSTSSSEAIAGSGTINLHKVSKTGSYNDLLDKPSIPTVNNSTITIQKNGTNIDSFTTNTASGKNINITLAKGDVGLGNVDNTSDATKNSATATLDNKTIDGGTF